ncbi:hypothetical protein DL767_001564 [Monosporascus sp. MG133]|nr:hypothetical protein DL767_001564 [Monosporascus sp. MG133]
MPRKRKVQDDPASSSAKRQAGGEEPQSPNHHGFEPYPPSKVYRLVEPGPVLLVTTGSLADSTHNVMTIGFHMVIQHESPPLLGITLGPWDASFATLKKRRECVLAVPSVEMAGMVVDVGNCSADDQDDAGEKTSSGKWQRFGLEALPAAKVKAPLVGGPDVIANIECVVEDTRMVSRYSMWVLRPVKAWLNPQKKPGEGGRMFHHRGDGTFVVDGEVLDLKHRMVKWQEFQD